MRYAATRTAVIISTRNRSHSLGATLRSLTGQTASPAQIIVISSSDKEHRKREKPVISRIRPARTRIRYVRVPHVNKAHNLNIARRFLTSDVTLIAFTDDDCILPASWIADSVAAHNRYASAGVITGPCRSYQTGYLPRVYSAIATPPGNRPAVFPFTFGGNMTAKRSALDMVGWFREAFTRCEDFELSHRLRTAGIETLLVPAITIETTYPSLPIPFYRRAYEHGKYEYLVNEAYRTPLKDQYTPGNRHPVLRSLVNLPFLLARLVSRFRRERRDPAYFWGYMTFELAKVAGMWTSLIRYHTDAAFRRKYSSLGIR